MDLPTNATVTVRTPDGIKLQGPDTPLRADVKVDMPRSIRLEMPDRELRARLVPDGPLIAELRLPKEPLKIDVTVNAKIDPVKFAEAPKQTVDGGQPPTGGNGKTTGQGGDPPTGGNKATVPAPYENLANLVVIMLVASVLGAAIRTYLIDSLGWQSVDHFRVFTANLYLAIAAASFAPVLVDIFRPATMSTVNKDSGAVLVFFGYCAGAATLGSELLQALLLWSRRQLARIGGTTSSGGGSPAPTPPTTVVPGPATASASAAAATATGQVASPPPQQPPGFHL